MSWLICIGGSIANGKTTLAAALQVALPNAVRLHLATLSGAALLPRGANADGRICKT